MVVGAVAAKLPWFSQKLAEPMGRWMFKADTRAAVLLRSGGWLSAIAGVVLGGLMLIEGYQDMSLSKTYGVLMLTAGLMSIIAAPLLLSGVGIPVAAVLLLLVAVVTVVAAWLKPDQIERWIDRALHYGVNETGAFIDLDEQALALTSVGGR
jgi:uncharacterized membrane protein YphA (DoxX/SURF4 family)